jgi:hypothetical protein
MATLLGTILADFNTSLASDIAVGGTTATLSSATDDDSVALPSGRYFFTIDGSNTSKEHISCDLSGISLTNIKSVSRQGVETTGVARKHRIGATVTITDFGHIKYMNDLVAGATTFNASAPLGYDDAPASLTGNQFATVAYVLATVSGGTVVFDQQLISTQTSGEALAINDFIYLKEADAKWYKVDADTTTTYEGLQTGFNKTTAAGADVTIQVAISGPVSGFSGLTAGSKYYASTTAGAITDTAPTNSMFVGWALTTTQLLFNPSRKTVPSQFEKDAMVGTLGAPKSTNKFVTADNISLASTDQSQTTQDAVSAFGEADSTGLRNLVAQSIIPARTKQKGVYIYKTADTGTFTGTVTITLEADSAGSPSGTPLATQTISNIEWVNQAVGEIEVLFASEYSATIGTTYWLVADTSTSDSSNHPNIGTNSAGGYTSGSMKYKNTTDGWVAIATTDLYFKTIEGTNSQVVQTNSSGKIENTFYSRSEMPTPVYDQKVYYGTSTPNVQTMTSTADGSVLYVALGASPGANDITVVRYARNLAGRYLRTHSVNVITNSQTAYDCGLTVYGSYLYIHYGVVTSNVYDATRCLAADLTGATSMTVPVIATTIGIQAWNDGTFFYVQAKGSTTVTKMSLSGTTFSTVSTGTSHATIGAITDEVGTFFDGKNNYMVSQIGTTISIYKFTAPFANTISTTTTTNSYLNCGTVTNTTGQGFGIPVDSELMYIILVDTADQGDGSPADPYGYFFTPFTKP